MMHPADLPDLDGISIKRPPISDHRQAIKREWKMTRQERDIFKFIAMVSAILAITAGLLLVAGIAP